LDQNGFSVQFAVFEGKVTENTVTRDLMKKGGDNLPIVAANISVGELKELMDANPDLNPNVVFEKRHPENQTLFASADEHLVSQVWVSPQ
jgi:hypothetical protein